MSNQSLAPQSPPRWIPDLFAWLFEQMEESASIIIARDLKGKCVRNYRSDCRAVLEAIQASDGYAPDSILEFLMGEAPPDHIERRLIVMLVIDEAFADMGKGGNRALRGEFLPPGILAIRALYLATGNCAEDDKKYIVLPAESPPELEDESAKAANTVLKSGGTLHGLLEYSSLMFPSEFSRQWKVETRCAFPNWGSALDDSGAPDIDRFRIAFAPLVQSPSEIQRRNAKIGGVSKLAVELTPSQERQVKTRAREVVDRAAKEGAHIVVMPEWVVSDAVLKEIQNAIKETARKSPEYSAIQLVIAGTGPTVEVNPDTELPYAECVVFDGRGKRIWSQRKLHPWVMSEQQQRNAGIEPIEPRGLMEGFHSSNTVVVADTLIGRCVILICEDVVQEDPPVPLILKRLRPRWLFVPIFDGPIKVKRWPAERAKQLSRTFGATVVVCNSLALLPKTCSERMVDFGWMVSRLDSQKFMRAAVNIPIAEVDSVVDVLQWGVSEAFERDVIEKPSDRTTPV